MSKQGDRHPRIGVGVLVHHEGRVLMGQRKGAHGEGEWAPPGGHLEFGESIEACAARELEEETGLQALSLRLGPATNNLMHDRHYVTLFVHVDAFAGELSLKEPEKCNGWHWRAWDSLPEPLFAPLRSLVEERTAALVRYQDSLPKFLARVLAFNAERDWGQFHSPKNLVMDLASEVGELVEQFRWLSEEDSAHLDAATTLAVSEEIGDVLSSLVNLAHSLRIDPLAAGYDKLEKMAKRYPVHLSRGKALKYTAYEALSSETKA